VSFSLWADAEEHEVILFHSLEHLYNLSEIKYLCVQHKPGHCIKASGPSGEVKFEGKSDPDLELQRLRLEFVEKLRRNCKIPRKRLRKIGIRIGSPSSLTVLGISRLS